MELIPKKNKKRGTCSEKKQKELVPKKTSNAELVPKKTSSAEFVPKKNPIIYRIKNDSILKP